MNAPLEAETEQVATQIVDACFKVHSALGPGLLESVYEVCLAHEFQKRGLAPERQKVLAVVYDGVQIESGLRLDFLVENRCIVEMKAIEEIMKTGHKGKEAPIQTIIAGKADEALIKKFLTYYEFMGTQKPPQGDAAAWKKKTAAVVDALKGLEAKKAGALDAFKEATNCKACHTDFKPKK